MIIYPAIDIKDGKCVRLSQGDFGQVTVFSDTPYEIARQFSNAGAKYIHVVDLDGAKEGQRVNASVIHEIVVHADGVPVQLGGGIRNMRDIERALKLGVSHVILGTAAAENPEFLKEAVHIYGDKIVVGIDAKDGIAATHGWEQVSGILAADLARSMVEMGVKTIIYTDIATDGMLQGPNVAAMKEMAELVPVDVIASGGVSCLGDIEKLRETGVSGAIVGKALYAGKINLKKLLSWR